MNSNQLGKHLAQNNFPESHIIELLGDYGKEIYSEAYVRGYIAKMHDMERIRACAEKRRLREYNERVERIEDAKTDGKRKI